MLGTLSILIVAHVFLVLFPTPDLIMYHSNMHVSLYVVTLLYHSPTTFEWSMTRLFSEERTTKKTCDTMRSNYVLKTKTPF